MNLVFQDQAWDDYLYWQANDPKMLRRINELIRDCARTPFTGLGKPEPLRHRLAGWWSRRISQEHRLVYRLRDGELLIAQLRYHYVR